MKVFSMIIYALLFLSACQTLAGDPDAGVGKCYDSDGRVDSTYNSSYACKQGGGTWK